MISHLFVVDETSIIAKKKSPVRLVTGFAKTPSERAFNYLITGDDDHSIISLPDPKETRAHVAGKKELYDELIHSLEVKLKDVSTDEITDQLSALDNSIAQAVDSLNEKTGTIREFQLARQTAFDQQHTAESRLIVIGELLTRFRVRRNTIRPIWSGWNSSAKEITISINSSRPAARFANLTGRRGKEALQ